MIKIKFHGHSCFEIFSGDSNLIIDPWLSDNPLADIKPDDVKAKYILVSHGHSDHFGDALEIAKQNDGTIIAPFELATFCEQDDSSSSHVLGGGYSLILGI